MDMMKIEMDVPRDFVEIVVLVDGVIEKAMAKAPAAEYVTLIGKLSSAIDGAQNVGPAVSGQYRDECAAYLVKTLMERLAPGKAPEVEAAPAE